MTGPPGCEVEDWGGMQGNLTSIGGVQAPGGLNYSGASTGVFRGNGLDYLMFLAASYAANKLGCAAGEWNPDGVVSEWD